MRDSPARPDAPGASGQLARAVRRFRERFERDPAIAASAPGRVNLIGDHTDYNDGFVLPMAIDRAAVVVAAPVPAGRPSTMCSADLGTSREIRLGAAPQPIEGTWTNYLVGVAAQFRDAGFPIVELDLVLASGVPVGAGLGSSAAIEVAMATALEHAHGRRLDPVVKADLCRRAEHAFAGTPCGIMDQLVATSARADHALLIDCRTLERRPIPMPPGAVVVVADSGVRHALADGGYARRRAVCLDAARATGLAALRDARPADLRRASLTETQARRARHVIAENDRTLDAAAALERGDLEAMGRLMLESHASLRDDFEVSCPELDTLVDAAAALAGDGVIGARMTGGGFGGCAVVLCRSGAEPTVMGHLGDRFAAVHGRRPGLFPVEATGAARSHEVV